MQFDTPINRGVALKLLQSLPNPTVKESKLNRLGYQEITLERPGSSPLTITLKFDGTWVASTPFDLGGVN